MLPHAHHSKKIGSTNDTKDKKGSRSCNCKRSSCLKLYCECFANGSYCQVSKCNCTSCHNNAENNHIRKVAIESTLERNPHAFRSKIFVAEKIGDNTSTKHHKGCHCKKSNCLKKYCECFQGGVVCSEKCRCLECRNFAGSMFRQDAIHRAQLKEKHGEGEVKTFEQPFESEKYLNQFFERKMTHPIIQRNNMPIFNEDNVINVTQNLINIVKTSNHFSKRKFEEISPEHPQHFSDAAKNAILDRYFFLFREIVSDGVPYLSQMSMKHCHAKTVRDVTRISVTQNESK